MSNVPSDLKYSKSHEWIKDNGDGTITVGITEHAQELLGDMVFVEVPEEGREVSSGEDCAVVESVKAASDVYSPVSGEVVAANEALADSPETVNTDAFGDGWMFKVKLSDASELEALLDASAYQELVESES